MHDNDRGSDAPPAYNDPIADAAADQGNTDPLLVLIRVHQSSKLVGQIDDIREEDTLASLRSLIIADELEHDSVPLTSFEFVFVVDGEVVPISRKQEQTTTLAQYFLRGAAARESSLRTVVVKLVEERRPSATGATYTHASSSSSSSAESPWFRSSSHSTAEAITPEKRRQLKFELRDAIRAVRQSNETDETAEANVERITGLLFGTNAAKAHTFWDIDGRISPEQRRKLEAQLRDVQMTVLADTYGNNVDAKAELDRLTSLLASSTAKTATTTISVSSSRPATTHQPVYTTSDAWQTAQMANRSTALNSVNLELKPPPRQIPPIAIFYHLFASTSGFELFRFIVAIQCLVQGHVWCLEAVAFAPIVVLYGLPVFFTFRSLRLLTHGVTRGTA